MSLLFCDDLLWGPPGPWASPGGGRVPKCEEEVPKLPDSVELVALFEVVVLKAKEIPNTVWRKKNEKTGFWQKVVANVWPICQKCLQIVLWQTVAVNMWQLVNFWQTILGNLWWKFCLPQTQYEYTNYIRCLVTVCWTTLKCIYITLNELTSEKKLNILNV